MTQLVGCAWRTGQADYVFGPTLFRFNGLSPGHPGAMETVTGPLLLEGGGQFGLSVGVVSRFALVPSHPNRSQEESGVSGVLVHSSPGRWHFSPVYLKAPLAEPPVFIRRTVIGAQGGAGAEENTLTIGYSSVTATVPRDDAVYELEYDSRHPMDATLHVTATRQTMKSTTQHEKEKHDAQ